VGNYCYVAVCSEARRGLGAHGEGEGLGHIVAAARLVTSAEKIIFSSAFFCLLGGLRKNFTRCSYNSVAHGQGRND